MPSLPQFWMNGRVCGFEALEKWEINGEQLPPGSFIALPCALAAGGR